MPSDAPDRHQAETATDRPPEQPPIVVIAPFGQLARMIEAVLPSVGDMPPVEVRLGDLAEGVRQGIIAERRGAQVIVSRGGTALALRRSVSVPVVEIGVSGFDIAHALARARRLASRAAVIGFPNVVEGVRDLAPLLGVELVQMPVDSEEEVPGRLREAAENGIHVVIGDAVGVRQARRHGLTAVLIRSSPRSIVLALQEACRIYRASVRERENLQRIQVMLDSIHDGLIAVDRSGTISLFNEAASRLSGISRDAALGASARQLLPVVPVDTVLEAGKAEAGRVVEINGRKLVCTCLPVLVDARVAGAVVTLQDVQKLQTTEMRVRRELHLKGHVARHRFEDIIAVSPAMVEVVRSARLYAVTESNILITGETGTGKELLAQGIHNASLRREGPFVAINCPALPASLLETELFGYEEGAFTGARRGGKPGLFELAHTGTIFLDEIGDLPLDLQARLLRVLEQRQVLRVGGDRVVPVDVRVIAATNRPLEVAIRQGRFREDLYHRLNVLRLHIPPLRERPEDLRALFVAFVRQISSRLGRPAQVDPRACEVLYTYSWPGNVRELANFTEQLVVQCGGSPIGPEQVAGLLARVKSRWDAAPPHARGTADPAAPETVRHGALRPLEPWKRELLEQILHEPGVSRAAAAARLGVSRSTLWRWLRRLQEAGGVPPRAAC